MSCAGGRWRRRLTRRSLVTASLWAIGATIHAGDVRSQESVPHTLSVEDVLSLKHITTMTAAPDGEWVAIVVRRASVTGERYDRYLDGADRSDLWLVSTRLDRRFRIRTGPGPSGSWQPKWSPSGRYLAYLSTAGDDNVRLYVWDRRTHRSVRLTSAGVELGATFVRADGVGQDYAWVSDSTLICIALGPGLHPWQFDINSRGQTLAIDAWRRERRGQGSTASLVASVPDSSRPSAALTVFTIGGARSRSLLSLAVPFSIRQVFALAPDGNHLAYVVNSDPLVPDRDSLLTPNYWDGSSTVGLISVRTGQRQRLEVIPADAAPAGSEASDFRYALPVVWSPNSSECAIVGRLATDDARSRGLFTIDTGSGRALRVTRTSLSIKSVQWVTQSVLLARATDESSPQVVWRWINTRSHDVFAAKVDSTLGDAWVWLSSPSTGVAITSTAVMRVSVRDSLLLARDTVAFGSTTWAAKYSDLRPSSSIATLLTVTASLGERSAYTFASSTVSKVAFPSDGIILDVGAASGKLFARVRYRDERECVLMASRQIWSPVACINEQFTSVRRPMVRTISYRASNGDSLVALLLLPPGYQPGHRYPAVVSVYPGMSVRLSDSSAEVPAGDIPSLDLELLAAHGFVVLLPSMPGSSAEAKTNPALGLDTGVLPAVDQIVRMGIADSARIGIIGHSLGGFATCVLIGTTDRFRAAVAMASPTDWTSLYGSLDIRLRYDRTPARGRFWQVLLESGAIPFLATPLTDPSRYVRNSAIALADHITTPLLLVHGDMDYVPLSQSEELYMTLSRLGRPVQLLRYWGEGHVIVSPANVRHLWATIFNWFDNRLDADRHERAH